MYCPNRDCPDFKATGRHGEYREGITVCPYCRSDLVPEDPARHPPAHDREPEASVEGARDGEYRRPSPDGEDLEPVYETQDASEVPVVRSFLDAQGIPHIVLGEERFDAFRGGLSPLRFNPRAGSVTFMVPVEFAEVARELLVEFDDEAGETGDGER